MKKKLYSLLLVLMALTAMDSTDSESKEDQGGSNHNNHPTVYIGKIINNTDSDLRLTWSNGRRIFLPQGDSIQYNMQIPFAYNGKKKHIESNHRLMLSSSNEIQIIFNKMVKTGNNHKSHFEASVYVGREDEDGYETFVFYAKKPGKKIKPNHSKLKKEKIPTYNDKHNMFEYRIEFTKDDNIKIDLYHQKNKLKKRILRKKSKKKS